MFKFNFQVEEDQTNDSKNATEKPEDTTTQKCANDNEPEFCYETENIRIEEKSVENLDVYKLNAQDYNVGDLAIQYVLTGFLLRDAQSTDNEDTKDIRTAEKSNSDLIPGVYEGGAKIWECTDDLLLYLHKEYPKTAFTDKFVLDLGCGSGLLGIYAFLSGAIVHFQDYNKDVLETITIPNVLLNASANDDDVLDIASLNDRIQFYSGDWSAYSQYSSAGEQKFDFILTSETIYNPQNHQKLLDCFDAKLKTDGVVLVAAKTYYFGVGGGLRQFEELIVKDKRFVSQVRWTAQDGVCREILELSRLNSN